MNSDGQAFIKRAIVVLVATDLWGALLFIAAGRIDWWPAWVFMAVYIVELVVIGIAMMLYNPGLAAERLKSHTGTKPFDKVFSALYTFTLLALPVVAGFDAGRFGWSSLPQELLYLGLLLQIAGVVPVAWAMATNPHLETSVRIQEDRGHKVISTGPYKYVRHPMYLGIIFMIGSAPLVLSSLWAFLPTLLIVALFIMRTAMEDRTLQAELAGYKAYAEKTRYRLLPGVW